MTTRITKAQQRFLIERAAARRERIQLLVANLAGAAGMLACVAIIVLCWPTVS